MLAIVFNGVANAQHEVKSLSLQPKKRGFFPRLRLWVRLANSLNGSWARMRPSSLFAKLSQ